MYRHVVTDVAKPAHDLVQGLGSIPSATLSDAMGRNNAMSHRIRPLYEGVRLAGTALTVQCPTGDNLMIHKAFQIASPGDVLVVDTQGSHDHGLLGENMALYARRIGLNGLVIDGSVRDSTALRRMRFPVFSVGVAPRSGVKETPGSINVPVTCGGIVVSPGDVVVGDDDGVVVIPGTRAEEVLEAARSREDMERQQAEQVQGGELPLEILYGPTWVDEKLDGQVTQDRA